MARSGAEWRAGSGRRGQSKPANRAGGGRDPGLAERDFSASIAGGTASAPSLWRDRAKNFGPSPFRWRTGAGSHLVRSATAVGSRGLSFSAWGKGGGVNRV